MDSGDTQGSGFLGSTSKSKQGRPNRAAFFDPGLATVLVIDDENTVIRMIEKSLEGRANVLSSSGVVPMGAMKLDDVDVIFLDYMMPGRDGFEILSEIREGYPDIPVIFMTAFGEPEYAEKAIELGATEFFVKPLQPLKIRRLVAHYAKAHTDRWRDPSLNNRILRAREEALRSSQSRGVKVLSATGNVIEGNLQRFATHLAVVEFPTSADFTSGDSLLEVGFKFGRQRVSSLGGIIGNVVEVSPSLAEVEIRIPGLWTVLEDESNLESDADDKGSASDPEAEDWTSLPDDLRLSIFDFAALLKELRYQVDSYSLSIDPSLTGIDLLRAEISYVRETCEKRAGDFWNAIVSFEKAAEEVVDSSDRRKAKQFARKTLFPFILGSPFLARIVERPIGVPGDFGMLGQIMGNPFEGHSLYDRIINGWILHSGAANAYRYRVMLLDREIRNTVMRKSAAGSKADILSMASGVGFEVQQFIQRPIPECEANFTLVDFSEDTLKEARRQYDLLGKIPDTVTLRLEESSVLELANRARGIQPDLEIGFEPDQQYDLVYCAGLFDYLSDRMIVRVVAYLHGLLSEGGELVVSNYTPKNPLKGLMTLALDWELIYRSEEHFASLVERAVPGADFTIEADAEGVEAYAIIKKS